MAGEREKRQSSRGWGTMGKHRLPSTLFQGQPESQKQGQGLGSENHNSWHPGLPGYHHAGLWAQSPNLLISKDNRKI